MAKTTVENEPETARGHAGELRHRPSIPHVLRWLSYHARPTHETHRGSRPPAALHKPKRP
jgi:hypothetical protein